MKARILIVDDEDIVIRSCQRILAGEHDVESVRSGFEALRRVDEGGFDVVLLDIMMPGVDGMEVLQHVKERHPEVDVIMMTGLAEVQTAVRAMKLGAFDYLSKPFDPDELKLVVSRALERRSLVRENAALKSDAGAKYRLQSMVGTSPSMQEVYRLVAQCAPTDCTVLITGESGTGKEMVARAIHHNSLRRDQPFVAIDCNTLAEPLLESELFGHVKGAFTGAITNKRGLFDLANRGTLFLDEFGNIPPTMQAKLLRVLQEREFKAVGDTVTRRTDVRLLAATNRDLKAAVAQGAFRDDLYYRIAVFPIHVPPLRERRDDIPALAMHFLERFARELHKPVTRISDGAMSLLVNHEWPGNVRELENVMQRAVIVAGDDVIRQGHLASLLDGAPPSGVDVPRTSEDLKRVKKLAREKSVEDIERAFVQETLRRNVWNVTRSAEAAGMQRANFQALMKKHGIRVRDTARDAESEPER
jgi:DNA-binding NtrC family response regulator